MSTSRCGLMKTSAPTNKVVIAILRVYLVDNNELELQATEAALSRLKEDIKVVGSSTCSEAAMKEILILKPNLVISDLYMKKMGGIGLMSALKAAGAECEFIILSQSWSPEAMRKFMHSGGHDFLLKPLDLQEMEKTLMQLQQDCALPLPHINKRGTGGYYDLFKL